MNSIKWTIACLSLYPGVRTVAADDTNSSSGYDDRTMTFRRDDRLNAGILALARQVEFEPTNDTALYNLALAYRIRGNFDQSILLWNRYIEHNPTNDTAYKCRGIVHNLLGNYDDAIKDFDKGIELNPKDAYAFADRGSSYGNLKKYSNALADYTQALKIDPNYDGAFNNLAWLRATCPDASLRNPKEAVILANKACETTKRGRWICVDTLGTAYTADGDFTNAIKYETMAAQMDGVSKNDLNEINSRLSLFEKHQPYIDK